MATPTTSFTDILLQTGRQYMRQARLLIPVSVLPYALSMILFVAFTFVFFHGVVALQGLGELFQLTNRYAVLGLVIIGLMLIIQTWGVAALLVAAMTPEQKSVGFTTSRALADSVWLLPRFVVWGVLTGLLLVCGYILGFIPYLFFSIGFSVFANDQVLRWTDGFSVFMPAVAFALTPLIAFFPCIMTDRAIGVFQGLRRARALVRGQYWNILVRFLFGAAILYILGYIIQFVPFFSRVVVWMFTVPIAMVYLVVLYRSLIESSTHSSTS